MIEATSINQHETFYFLSDSLFCTLNWGLWRIFFSRQFAARFFIPFYHLSPFHWHLFREIWSRKWLCYLQHRNTHSELCKLKTFWSQLINISQVSVCFKVFADFIRFGGQVGAVEIIRLNEPQPSMSLLCMYYSLQYYSIFFPFLSKSGTIELFILTDCEPWRQIRPIRS